MDDYKNSKEWMALNNIWKSMSKEQKDENFDKFKVVSDLIKSHYSMENSLIAKVEEKGLEDDYRYLDELSFESKQLVIALVNKGEKNLYHSIMATIESNRGKFNSVEQFWEYYSKRFGKSRPHIYSFEPQIKEIIELCLFRMDRKGINPLH